MIPTACPVPPMLEQTLGYTRDARFVAFYWEPAGDELAWADGQQSFVGAEWHAWLIFKDHPAVAQQLRTYNFGASNAQATHWLLIDRTARLISVGSIAEVRAALEQQWPPQAVSAGPLMLDQQAQQALLAQHVRSRATGMDEVRAALGQQRIREDELRAWLDAQIASQPAAPDIPLTDSLRGLLTSTDRTGLQHLIVAAYAAWETHYSGGYLYTDDPDTVTLFDTAREQYRAWRAAKVEAGLALDAQLRASDQLWQRLRMLAPDATYGEAVLLRAAHGSDVDDATARAWIEEQRTLRTQYTSEGA